MAIIDSLLIFPVDFQINLRDKLGHSLADGVIYLYSNTQRTVFKNWYYQSGTVAPYAYLPLPNPMTLDAAGNVSDLDGNVVIPGFYPYASDNITIETYFIQIYDQFGTLIQTIYNFPINPDQSAPPVSGSLEFKNLVINNRFWRNIGGPLTLTNYYSYTVAPSQHDGYATATSNNIPSTATPPSIGAGIPGLMSDITFNKNEPGSTETVQFQQFSLYITPPLVGDVVPEYYLTHVATSSAGSETLKYYQFPLSLHLRSLSSQSAVVTIQAIDNSGTGNGFLNLSFFQYQGTGQSSSVPVPFQKVLLTSGWNKYSYMTSIPSNIGTTVSSGPGDDALYLWVGLPASQTCNISFTLPSVYLSTEVPVNDFSNYDEVNSIICSPRTGDVRTSINNYYYYGWVPMNDGTICNSGSITAPSGLSFARQNIDTWPLFNLLWQLFKPYDTGSNFNPICQMYTNAGAATNYGSTAIADWNASKQIALTQMMGMVLLGTVPISALIPLYSSTFTGSGTTISVASTGDLFNGMPVTFRGTTTLTVGVIYYIRVLSGTTFSVYSTFNNAITGTSPLPVDVSGTFISAVSGSTEGEYSHTQLVAELAAHTHGPGGTAANFQGQGTGGSYMTTTSAGTTSPVFALTASTGSSTPFNVTQPGAFMNMYIKL